MFDLSYKWIRFTRSRDRPPSLPPGIERAFLQTPSGPLELLMAEPRHPMHKTPLVFCHGGMGDAAVWLEWMRYFVDRGVPSYAVSLRGHGASWQPSYLRMVLATTRHALADDLAAAVEFVQERKACNVVLVGHSSGAGLCQYILSEGHVRVEALVLLDAVPAFGSYDVYKNWAKLDPWFMLRMILHFFHPNSPLSHPALTKRAFFSSKVADSYVLDFQKRMKYESILWPWSMMRPFADAESVLAHIRGWGMGERVLVMYGSEDKLMTQPIMDRLAVYYREAVFRLVGQKKIEARTDALRLVPSEDNKDSDGCGVRFAVVPFAGHHVQNDVTWQIGSRKLLEFFVQLYLPSPDPEVLFEPK